MGVVRHLQEYLDKHKVNYKLVEHPETYTAKDTAASAHVPMNEFAKSVVVKLDGEYAMMVLPANHQVNWDALKEASGATEMSLASEAEFKSMFKDCELGAMPAIGNLYEDLPVYIENAWAGNDDIAFNAGDHHSIIEMRYQDYEELVHPKMVNS